MTPDSTTERVRDAVDIVRLIGGYMYLRKVGKRHVGLCPFHQEKSPSFNVDPIKQRWHCFGCSLGGDAFDFLMRIEGIDFRGAKRHLAELAGISLEDHKLSPEDARAWAAEKRAIERDLPAARLWRRTALVLGDDLLTLLKASIFDATAKVHPEVGEIAGWESRLARWRRIDGGELVHEYRGWRERDPQTTGAMVQAAAKRQQVERRALMSWLRATEAVAA
jgi:hypothetical protein